MSNHYPDLGELSDEETTPDASSNLVNLEIEYPYEVEYQGIVISKQRKKILKSQINW